MANEPGRPEYTDPQYEIWLEELRPFLQQGKSLSRSIELSGLNSKRTTLYEKYRLKDWYSDKVDAYRNEFGEKINDTFYTLIIKIEGKVKRGEDISDQEAKLLMFGAEKHRSAQPFFVNRFETAKGRPIEEIIDALDVPPANETIDDVTENIEKLDAGNHANTTTNSEQIADSAPIQMVAPDPSLQNPQQAGANNDLQPQPDPTAA